MYPVLERRTQLKLKKDQEKQAAAKATQGNFEIKKVSSATLTFEPEWSLTKKASIEFTEFFSAIKNLFGAYGIYMARL
jgi:hypothetical protein